ncbi:glycosyltransferase family 4 protein [Hymenobacter psoromatis]|uniref:glycosyltransferase family 4 protein n=1 Tax=Hymenobacter psoromatis TaxID=1484116 RepID=UPI001CC06F81|nr:glycosyltransferase family 4 protein [Hymenobacter psoromatis]
MKLLFLSHVFSPAIGGIEASSEFLANAFAEAGYEVRLMTMTAGEVSSLRYPVIRRPSVAEMLKQHAWADIVYENNPCMRLSWPKLLFGKPSVITLHTWISRADGTITLVDKLKFRWLAHAKKVIAVSQAMQQRCWPPAIVIGNSYEEQLFNCQSDHRNLDFVFLGRLVSDKGVELAIRAFSDMVFVHPIPELAEATLTIIGSGPDRELLESLAASLPAPSRIRFLGPLKGETLVTELNRHTFQFIPSTWEEPFGIVALEGIACGLIPIASNGGGLPDAIGNAGVTFERGNLASLITVTANLVHSPTQQAQCRAAAPGHLAAFGNETITRKFIDVLEEAGNS